ncbi:MAG: hypothetical protein ACRYFZ_01005 [Janthinobacterium lividum]
MKGLTADVAEPEGPFVEEEEQHWYDLLQIVRATAIISPEVFKGSYATTAQDARDKCQGNSAPSVTRTRISTVSLVDAIRLATLDAKAAIVCPVFNATYTTTAEDYTAKCGSGTSGASVTGYGSSGKDQATADATAKQDAISKITCPIPPKTYGITLSRAVPEGGSVSFSTSNNHQISFNGIANTAGAPADVVFSWNGQTSFATIPAEYIGQPFAFYDATGNQHDLDSNGQQARFIDGTVTF